MDYLFVIAGLAILFVGGEATLRGAIGLAKRLGVSPPVIGLTVIGFGTSAPELVVTVQAALNNQSDLAIGNVVGSNISNILLILGFGGMIWPLVCDRVASRRDVGMMLASMALLVVLGKFGRIEAWQGAIMFAVLLGYIFWSYRSDMASEETASIHEKEADEVSDAPTKMPLVIVLLVSGLIGLVGGAHLLVVGATGIALSYGIPESIIGLTIVAVGTSLPELAATVIAALRHHTDVAVANILGSCTFNILAILGITAMVRPLDIAPDIEAVDMWVMLGSGALLAPLLLARGQIGRASAMMLLAGYVVYIASIYDRLVTSFT